jgi:predicted SAM-dependent methyltransferase
MSFKKCLKKLAPAKLYRAYISARESFKYLKKSSAFKAANVYCPCCCKNFLKFEETKVDSRYNDIKLFPDSLSDVACPYCASYPRHRILCDYLTKHKGDLFDKQSEVLIFAPARAIQVWFSNNKIKFISADIELKYVDIQMDIQDIPFEKNKFDFISCDHVLEHVPDYHLAISELYRVAKIGGVVEITVPLSEKLDTTYEDETAKSIEERVHAFGQHDHLRVFGKDFTDNLEKVGFEVSIYDGDKCDKKIVPLIAPALYDYNKVFFCKKISPPLA